MAALSDLDLPLKPILHNTKLLPEYTRAKFEQMMKDGTFARRFVPANLSKPPPDAHPFTVRYYDGLPRRFLYWLTRRGLETAHGLKLVWPKRAEKFRSCPILRLPAP